MTAKVLFDTNAVIAWIEDEFSLYSAVPSDLEPVVGIITLGELEFGAAKSTRVETNRRRLQDAMGSFTRVQLDDATARIYGEMLAALKRKGRPIPTNDVWIAALALQHGLPLLTRDRHFQEVEGIDVRGW